MQDLVDIFKRTTLEEGFELLDDNDLEDEGVVEYPVDEYGRVLRDQPIRFAEGEVF